MQRANHPIPTIARAAATDPTETTTNSAATSVMTSAVQSPVAQSGNPADDVEPALRLPRRRRQAKSHPRCRYSAVAQPGK